MQHAFDENGKFMLKQMNQRLRALAAVARAALLAVDEAAKRAPGPEACGATPPMPDLLEDAHVFVFYALAVYTGMRAGEIAVQRSFDGPTKSDRVRYVPFLDPLLPDLEDSEPQGQNAVRARG